MTAPVDIDLFTQVDLNNALGTQIVNAVYDDGSNDGAASPAAITACIKYGSSECFTWLRANHYENSLPTSAANVPMALKFAALDFGIAYTMRRRPDLVKAMGEESWTKFLEAAVEKMKRYGATLQRLPRATATPANVGATVSTNGEEAARPASSTSPSERCSPPRRFDDMGDYT